MTDEHSQRDKLASALEGLGVDQAGAMVAAHRYAKRTRLLMWITGALAVVTALVVSGLIVLVVLMEQGSSDLERVQQRTSDSVLCPLYGAFLAAENNPIPPQIKNNPAQMRERAEVFKIIRQGAAQLGCEKR